MNKPRLIEANVTSNIIGGMIKSLTTPDGSGVRDLEIQAYNEGVVDVLELIDETPTAYDIDKVVEQLEALPNINQNYHSITEMIDREDAIEIVKGGANNA